MRISRQGNILAMSICLVPPPPCMQCWKKFISNIFSSSTACTGAQLYVLKAKKGFYFGDPPKEAPLRVFEGPGNPTVAEVSTYICGQYERFTTCCHPSDVARRDAGQIWKTQWIFF